MSEAPRKDVKAYKEVTIYCDGSSLGNGAGVTRAAAVALLGYRDLWRAVGRYLGNATNQQAEIAAATIGLETLTEACRVHVISDSRYVIETMSGRFRRKANHEWWARLDEAAKPHKITWAWTKGHAGHKAQEACDGAARAIATSGIVDEELLQMAALEAGSTGEMMNYE